MVMQNTMTDLYTFMMKREIDLRLPYIQQIRWLCKLNQTLERGEKSMNRCPKCGSYMSSHIEYVSGNALVVWKCECGYSSKNESYTVDYKTDR